MIGSEMMMREEMVLEIVKWMDDMPLDHEDGATAMLQERCPDATPEEFMEARRRYNEITHAQLDSWAAERQGSLQ
jgi:hypothetical protein